MQTAHSEASPVGRFAPLQRSGQWGVACEALRRHWAYRSVAGVALRRNELAASGASPVSRFASTELGDQWNVAGEALRHH